MSEDGIVHIALTVWNLTLAIVFATVFSYSYPRLRFRPSRKGWLLPLFVVLGFLLNAYNLLVHFTNAYAILYGQPIARNIGILIWLLFLLGSIFMGIQLGRLRWKR